MSECDVKHEERMRRYAFEVRYHPEWGAAVVHALGVGRDVPDLHACLTKEQWEDGPTRRATVRGLLARAEALLPTLPDPTGETPWSAADFGRAALFALALPAVACTALLAHLMAYSFRRRPASGRGEP